MIAVRAKVRIAVLAASYNRVRMTVANLGVLLSELDILENVECEVFLVDDASPDGTGAEVRRRFDRVRVVEGTGDLFWNRGMCLAYAAAQMTGAFDAYLLFNDDVELIRGRLADLMREFENALTRGPVIFVGAMLERATGRQAYGGYNVISTLNPLRLKPVVVNGQLQKCDTFNGNFVVVSGRFFESLGGLDPAYHHAYGDVDLGLMARRHGVEVFLWRKAIGMCDRNAPIEERVRRKPFCRRFRMLFLSPNEIGSHIHFVWKHGKILMIPFLVLLFVFKRSKGLL